MNVNISIRTIVRGTLLAISIPALSLPALAGVASTSTAVAGGVTKATHATTKMLPPTLRPVFYRTLAKDAGAAYNLNPNGCAVLPKQALRACFDAHGAHFTGTGSPLTLRLVAYGREGTLSPVKSVRPEVHANRVSYSHDNLTEWWRVLPMGFEQGFTLAKRPNGNGALTLALAANRQDAGAPTARHSRESGNPGGNTLAWGKLRYGKLIVTDAKGEVIPATLKHKGKRILIAVNDAHAAYPLTVDPLVWIEQKVTASDGAAGDNFGFSVALDGATALVGAYWANVGGHLSQGAAYVFTQADGAWSQMQKLTASDGATSNHFGISVALDGTTALVGAYWADVGGHVHQGATYVFTEAGGVWSQTAKLTASDGAAEDEFGDSVALDGTTALVGADDAGVGGHVYQGAAYVFTETGGVWSQAAKLTASDGAANDYFGHSVALDGTSALVGALDADVGGHENQGAAYVFTEIGGVWSQAAKLTASDGTAHDGFGWAVALDGATALVGADYAGVSGHNGQGAAYVFTETGDVWSQVQKLTASDGAKDDYFGHSVALDGATALVGTWRANLGGHALQGAAYVFTETGGVWSQVQKLTASDGAAFDRFGVSVALDGATALVGAFDADMGGRYGQGAAYVYNLADLGLAVSAPETVGQGQSYVNQAIATNNSSIASPAVAVTVGVPAAASFVSAMASQGSCNEASGVVTCQFGQINGNAGTATANVTLKATGASGTTIENTASVAKATPALSASAATEITSPGSCPAGYTEFSGHLEAGESFTSDPITVTEAGEKYVDLTAPASFAFFAITTTRYGQHTYVYPRAKHGHRWGAAGSYQVGVQASPDAGGDYTLCVNLNPPQ